MRANNGLRGLILTLAVCTLACTTDNKQQTPADESNKVVSVRLTEDTMIDWQSASPLAMEWSGDVLWLEAESQPVWWTSRQSYGDFAWEFEISSNDLSVLGFGMDANATGGYTVSLDTDSASLNPKGTILNHARSNWTSEIDTLDWAIMRIVTNGGRIKVFVNEKQVCFTRDHSFLNGVLGIQVHGKVGLRDFKVRSLEMKEPNRLVEEVYRSDEDHDWIDLFKDQSLAGWTSTGTGNWTFEPDSSLKGVAGESPDFLVSDSIFQDFYLTLDFKIGNNENSGVFVRKSPDSLVSLTDAIECNIYDFNGPAHAFSSGSMVTHARAWYGMVTHDQWNTMEIFARGRLVVIYLNQRKASEHLFDPHFTKPGQIALQAGTRVFSDNGPSTVYFKNIRIKDFSP